jgi:Acetyltransferase (GNAT) family
MPSTSLQSPSPAGPHVRPAATEDLDTASATLSDGFAADLVFRWLAGRPLSDVDLLPVFRALLRGDLQPAASAAHGGESLVHIDRVARAAAAWRAPSRRPAENPKQMRMVAAFVNDFRLRRCLPALKSLAMIEASHPTHLPPHYYLVCIATRSAIKGSGCGSRVINNMLDVCDAEGVPAYLECSNPASIPFYLNHKFVSRGLLPVRNGCPPVVGMWREPPAVSPKYSSSAGAVAPDAAESPPLIRPNV